MQPLDFLAAVLPSTGIYVACAIDTGNTRRKHAFCNTLSEVIDAASAFNADGDDVYFGIASFTESGSRKAENAKAVRSLCIDIDCAGRDYETNADGLAAFHKFVEETGLGVLGEPWIVDTGGGYHVYWPLEGDKDILTWKALAEAFKRLAKKHGFKIDFTCTSDAARVMRLPGARSYKRGCQVKVVQRGDTFQYEDLKRVIGYVEVERVVQAIAIEGQRPKISQEQKLKLLAETSVKFRDIMVKTLAGNGCGQLKFYVENAQEEGMEPLWRGLLSIAKVCDDADHAAKKLSAMHPYPQERMERKLAEIKGPYPCAKFDSENPGVCDHCPHWGRITNPLALAREQILYTDEKEVVTTKDDEEVIITRPEPPEGYGYGPDESLMALLNVKEEGSKATKVVKIKFLPYPLFAVDVLHVEDAHTAHLVALRPEGAKDVILESKAFASKDETIKALAEQNIIATGGSVNDKLLYEYVRVCFEELSLRIKSTSIPTQYGWQKDESFVWNGQIFYPNGSSRVSPMPGLENITVATKPNGTLEAWKEVVNLLVRRRLYEVLAHGCIGFGAPLMCFTGMRGLTFHAGHKESGTGKSLALSIAASVWGHPIDYRTGKSTSPVAMQQRAGNLNSLPFLSDELTMKTRADADWFPAFVFDFSEGRGKERMEAKVNRERLNTTTWATLAFVTSNTRMLDYMTGVRQTSSEGELRRFLEWSPSTRLSFTPAEQRAINSLQNNYGVAGERYAQWLVGNQETAKSITTQVREKIFDEFAATNDERFWVAGVAAVVAGAILAGRNYANVIDLPVEAIKDVFKQLVNNAREAISGAKLGAADILNDYIREFYGQFIITRSMNGGGRGLLLGNLSMGSGDRVDKSITRTKVMGRVEHDLSPGWVDFYIEEGLLKRHCSLFGYGYKDFQLEIANRYKVSYMSKNMLADTGGPSMQVKAIHISMKVEDANGVVSEAK
jgi:hypothetical protein